VSRNGYSKRRFGLVTGRRKASHQVLRARGTGWTRVQEERGTEREENMQRPRGKVDSVVNVHCDGLFDFSLLFQVFFFFFSYFSLVL